MNQRISKSVIFASTIQRHEVMEEKEFIVAEVKKRLSASVKRSRYEVIEAANSMPAFEGFILPCYVSATEGKKYRDA